MLIKCINDEGLVCTPIGECVLTQRQKDIIDKIIPEISYELVPYSPQDIYISKDKIDMYKLEAENLLKEMRISKDCAYTIGTGHAIVGGTLHCKIDKNGEMIITE